MRISLLDRLLRRRRPLAEAAAEAASCAPHDVSPGGDETMRGGEWSSLRLAQAEALWGEGFLWPGGAAEIKRLTAPFGLSPAHSLLMVGIGAGGPARAIAGDLGSWVSGFEADPALVEVAQRRIQRAAVAQAKRATIAAWDPTAPAFAARGFHHGLLLDVLDQGDPVTILGAAVRAIKQGGQIMVVQSVIGPADTAMERTIRVALAALGCDMRLVEDESDRHARQVLKGWKSMLRQLRGIRPSAAEAEALVREAAFWLFRLRRIREREIRLLRWGAIVT